MLTGEAVVTVVDGVLLHSCVVRRPEATSSSFRGCAPPPTSDLRPVALPGLPHCAPYSDPAGFARLVLELSRR